MRTLIAKPGRRCRITRDNVLEEPRSALRSRSTIPVLHGRPAVGPRSRLLQLTRKTEQRRLVTEPGGELDPDG